jgi:hypothetical protein
MTFSHAAKILYPLSLRVARRRTYAPRTCEESAFLRTYYANHNSEIRNTPAPFRGEITIARYVSAGSTTDRDHARFARHHTGRRTSTCQSIIPSSRTIRFANRPCECLCGGGFVRPRSPACKTTPPSAITLKRFAPLVSTAMEMRPIRSILLDAEGLILTFVSQFESVGGR